MTKTKIGIDELLSIKHDDDGIVPVFNFVEDKEEIKDILSKEYFIPASAISFVFMGVIDGEFIFADAKKLKEATDEVYKKLTKKVKSI
jgi:hypothetical protein